MTLDSLRCFRALVETGSFRAAAERVHRTQPAVTHQIKALERELGRVLFDRKAGKPTPAGQRLYERACALLADADSLAREVKSIDEAELRELRLGTSDTTALYVLPPLIRRFRRVMPGTRLVIVNRPSDAVAELVSRGELDLGIVTLPVGRRELEERLLFEQELVLVVPASHPLTRWKRLTIEDLVDEPMLLLDDATRTGALLRDYFRSVGFQPHVAMNSGSFEVIKRYVAEEVGVSFLPDIVVIPADRRIRSIRLPGLPRVAIGLITRRGVYRSKGEDKFVRLVESMAR